MKIPPSPVIGLSISLLLLNPAIQVGAHDDHSAKVSGEIIDSAKKLEVAFNKKPSFNQKLIFDFNSPKRTSVDFLPLPSHSDIGVQVGLMKDEQVLATHALLRNLLSDAGYLRVQTIQSLEDVLRNSSPGEYTGVRKSDAYQIQFFGTPERGTPFGIKLEGHHLSLNFTVVDGETRGTPLFLGANPAKVEIGLKRGLRALAPHEDFARDLVASLNEEQQSLALQNGFKVIIDRGELSSSNQPKGLPAGKMSSEQQDILVRVINSFISMLRPELANEEIHRLEEAGIEKIHFISNGETEPGEKHYYHIQGPTVNIEFQAMNENHVHCLWSDPETDFGKDLLREHLAEQH